LHRERFAALAGRDVETVDGEIVAFQPEMRLREAAQRIEPRRDG
jgi:RNase P/RNase MRP subunit p29